jgi:hypothetical protein
MIEAGSPRHWWTSTTLNGVISQNTEPCIIIDVRASSLSFRTKLLFIHPRNFMFVDKQNVYQSNQQHNLPLAKNTVPKIQQKWRDLIFCQRCAFSWDVVPCQAVVSNSCHGADNCLQLQGRSLCRSTRRHKQMTAACTFFYARTFLKTSFRILILA